MSETVAPSPYTLSDSTFKTRPDTKAFLVHDIGSQLKADREITGHRLNRGFTMGAIPFRKPEAFSPVPKTIPTDYKRVNDSGDWRVITPSRGYDTTSSTVNSSLSPGKEAFEGGSALRSVINENMTNNATRPLDKPQQSTPEVRHDMALPKIESTPDGYRYEGPLGILSEIEPRRIPTYQHGYHDRSVQDVVVRGKIAAWAQSKVGAPVSLEPQKEQLAIFKESVKQEMPDMDKWTLQQFYSSSTTKGFKDVPWDAMLNPKRVPCPTHWEAMRKPDSYNLHEDRQRYPVPAEYWNRQYGGRSWDEEQYHERSVKQRANQVILTTKYPRAQQIPLYSGCLGSRARDGGEVLEDPAQKEAKPLTVKRSDIPSYAALRWCPHIPGFAGCYQRLPELSAHLPRQEEKVFYF